MQCVHEKEHSKYFSAYHLGIKVAALLMVGGSVSCAAEPIPLTYAEAHFAALCPSGGEPVITEVSHSGVMPAGPDGNRRAWGAVRLACFPSQSETPVLVQDAEHGGRCLGFGKDRHLTVGAEQPGPQAPEFFATYGWVGVAGSSDLRIIEAQLHYHDPSDTYNQEYYRQNHCGPLPPS